jgi:transposase
MRPPGAPDQLEQRRRRAVRLLQAGRPMSAVARQVQASVSSVWRWWQTYRRAGPRGLRPTPTPGRPRRLSGGQLRALDRILARGPRRAGYPTDLWTLARVAKVIQRQFGIRYHPSHVWRLLTARGWQCQPLAVRGGEADVEAHAAAGAAPSWHYPGSLDLRTSG